MQSSEIGLRVTQVFAINSKGLGATVHQPDMEWGKHLIDISERERTTLVTRHGQAAALQDKYTTYIPREGGYAVIGSASLI
jgi:hypothetical protein